MSGLHLDLDLGRGPLLSAAYLIRNGRQPDLLLLAAHHLIIDSVSWWVLLEDLQSACDQLASGSTVRLPAKTTSSPAWARALSGFANSPGLRDELAFWIGSSSVKHRLPRDRQCAGAGDLSSTHQVSRSLDTTETTRLLHQVPKVYSTQVTDILLTALAQVLNAWSGETDLCLDVEGHGREDIGARLDLLRSVGWFTTVYPVKLRCEPGLEPGRALMSVKEQLRAVPRRGVGYGALRYLSNDTETKRHLSEAPGRELLFNYLGQWDQQENSVSKLRLARPIMVSHGKKGPRQYLMEINAVVFAGRLQVDWSYSADAHRESTINSLADGFIERLRSLLAHCLSAGDDGLTPSDFPHADLDQDGLDELLAEFGEEQP